jgi:hypothetical protein
MGRRTCNPVAGEYYARKKFKKCQEKHCEPTKLTAA